MINHKFSINWIRYILKQVLNRPLWVFFACLVLIFFNVVYDGTLLRMWNLFNSRKTLEKRLEKMEQKNFLVEKRLKKLSDSKFLEKEAKDRLNLIGEEDIVFIFSEDSSEEP